MSCGRASHITISFRADDHSICYLHEEYNALHEKSTTNQQFRRGAKYWVRSHLKHDPHTSPRRDPHQRMQLSKLLDLQQGKYNHTDGGVYQIHLDLTVGS